MSKKKEGVAEIIVTYDEFDREIQKKEQTINGKWIITKTEYDIFGRKIKLSQPFFEGESIKWNSIEYDAYSRPIKNVTFTNKVYNTCYEGLKVTVDDGYQKTSKTVDAMGNVIRFQDHGELFYITISQMAVSEKLITREIKLYLKLITGE
ncbi:hypothetical protein [Chryseobacterium wanjuense]